LASSLAESGKKVTLVSKYEKVMPALDNDLRSIVDADIKKRINVESSSRVVEINKIGNTFRVRTEKNTHEADEVIFATGIKPNSEIAADAGIDIDKNNAIITDEMMETSVQGIYAAGDVASIKNRITGKNEMMPLAQIANKTGRVAGSNAAGSRMEFPGAIGTTLVKIFDYEIGFTGLNESRAKQCGYEISSTFITAGSRANYYPGKKPVHVKIIFEKKSGRILGGQAIGTDGAAWRLNTLATAIYGGFTVTDLFYDDLGYTPPFGPVWDPLVIAGSVSMRE
ncbi:MAG: FAD-dependent oxidoreductase, partial [Thermoplasmata archaeon]